MPESVITFLKGDSVDTSTDYSDALPVNMTGIAREIFGIQGYMLETPGVSAFGSGFGTDRGGVWNERVGFHYRVSGLDFCEVSQVGTSTSLGSVPGFKQASFPYSFETQGIIADGRFFLYDSVNGFRQVTDVNVRTPIDGVWIDGYYCLTDGEFLYHTDIVAGTPVEDQIQPLALATAEFSPDPTLGVGRTSDNKWIAFNRYTTEFFQNVGGDTFAFQRVQGRAINVGIVATHAKTQIDDIWFFVGGRKGESTSVYAMGGSSADKVASRQVEKILQKYADSQLTYTVMESRQFEGYSYLIIHLPNEVLMCNLTLAKNVGFENAWSYLTTGTSALKWRAINGVFDPRIGVYIYGDKQDDRLGKLNYLSCEQYGEIQEWYLNTPFTALERARIDQLEVQTIPGFTSTLDATVFMSITFNGVTYSQERSMSYGNPSEYGKRFIARQALGYVSDWFSIRLRGASRSRMAFSVAKIKYG